jgi:hypothetical protein
MEGGLALKSSDKNDPAGVRAISLLPSLEAIAISFWF